LFESFCLNPFVLRIQTKGFKQKDSNKRRQINIGIVLLRKTTVPQLMMKALIYIIFYYLKGFLTKILFEIKKANLFIRDTRLGYKKRDGYK